MYSSKRTKFTALLIATLVALACLLTACGETAFQPLSYSPTVESIESNGSLVVKVNETNQSWYYYINGQQTSNTGANTYTSDPKVGQIYRIKTTDLQEIIDEVVDGAEVVETEEQVYEKSELVVPYVYYTGSTVKVIEGIYIFNSRLYYKTPNYYLNNQGEAKSSEMLINSCKLDGSDTQTHLTLSSVNSAVALMEEQGSVYAVYRKADVVDGTTYTRLAYAVLTNSNVEEVFVSKAEQNIDGVTFDTSSNTVFYVDGDGAICAYKAGATAEVELVEESDSTTYAIAGASRGSVFYTKTSSIETLEGVFATKIGGTEHCVYSAYAPLTSSLSASLLCYNTGSEDVLIVTCVVDPLASIPTYEIFALNANGEKINIIEPNTVTTKITFVEISGDNASTLIYTIDTKVYAVDLAQMSATQAIEPTLIATSTCKENVWASYDIVDGLMFRINSSNSTLDCVFVQDEAEHVVDLSYIIPDDAE